jgi:hypothetical protein
MEGIILPTILERIATRKDHTLALTFGTQEMSPADAGKLYGMINKLTAVYVTQKETVSQDEINKVDELNPDLGGKSQSERIRNTLYVLWGREPEGFDNFDNYYHSKTERIIKYLKKKLNP